MMSAPCPAWCQFKDDVEPHDVHSLVVFDGPPTVVLLQTDEYGAFPSGMIRLFYYVDGRRRQVEVRTTIAADFGNIIASLTAQSMGDFAAALVGAYDLLDVEEFEVVPNPHSSADDVTEGDAR